jgi:hypothetical protein
VGGIHEENGVRPPVLAVPPEAAVEAGGEEEERLRVSDPDARVWLEVLGQQRVQIDVAAGAPELDVRA